WGRHQQPANHEPLFAEIGYLEVVEHRTRLATHRFARPNLYLIPPRRQADARVRAHAVRGDAITRFGPEREIELGPGRRNRLALRVEAEEGQLDLVGDRSLRIRLAVRALAAVGLAGQCDRR